MPCSSKLPNMDFSIGMINIIVLLICTSVCDLLIVDVWCMY